MKVSTTRTYYIASILFVVLCIWAASKWMTRHLEIVRLEAAAALDAKASALVLQTSMEDTIVHLLVAARVGEVGRARELYVSKVEEDPYIHQLGWLDASGREVLRVERRAGQVVVVDDDELEDKSRRSYYQRTMKLPLGTVYVSRLDLNQEDGAPEVPWRPAIRLATRTTNGVVVLDVNAARLLTPFAYAETDSAPIHRWLLNSRGYWLAGRDDSMLWGFMFGRATTAAAEFPTTWNRIQAREDESWVDHDRILSAALVGFDTAAGTSMVMHPVHNEESWWIVSYCMIPSWISFSWETVFELALLVLFCGFVGWKWSDAVEGERRAEAANARAQQELVRSERMASLGRLVAGVSHELNTPIGNAFSTVTGLEANTREIADEMASGKLKKTSVAVFVQRMQVGIGILVKNIERSRDLVGEFKTVAVDQTSENRRDVDFDDYIQSLVGTLRPSLKHAPFELRIATASGVVLDTFPGAVAQVVMNLVNNASIHAFQHKQSGYVRIETRTAVGGAELLVEDNGDGIPPEVGEKVFDPFFTTRLGQGGSGLGLTITRNLVCDLLGGTITVDSRAGQFTRFRVWLPRSAPDPDLSDKDPRDVYRASA